MLRVLAISMFAFVGFASLDNVAVVFLVRDVLHGGSLAYGAAMSAFGVGMILGALALVRRWSNVHPATVVSRRDDVHRPRQPAGRARRP